MTITKITKILFHNKMLKKYKKKKLNI